MMDKNIEVLTNMVGSFGVGVVLVVLALLAAAWFFLPFAIFGVKKRLDLMTKQNAELIEILTANSK